ncbi:MAG: hypothetical protein E7K65_16365, partial [Pseudomonas sp.]|nr:hypothetical protein [Pseudomonas sp.]
VSTGFTSASLALETAVFLAAGFFVAVFLVAGFLAAVLLLAVFLGAEVLVFEVERAAVVFFLGVSALCVLDAEAVLFFFAVELALAAEAFVVLGDTNVTFQICYNIRRKTFGQARDLPHLSIVAPGTKFLAPKRAEDCD